MTVVFEWSHILALRAKQPRPSCEPIKTTDLKYVNNILCQRVVMNGGGGDSFWVRVESEVY